MAMSYPHYFQPDWITLAGETIQTDLCIYGATSAGIIAARTGVARGLRVELLQPGKHIGGLTTGGLGWTDYGKKHVIGGAARQFYRDLGAYYGLDTEEWHFEPHAATAVYERYLKEAGVRVRFCQFLDHVTVKNQRITHIRLLGGRTVQAAYFMDATYEGDLLAKAGVRFHVGREANTVYGETINGVQVRAHHQFSAPVDPYVSEGNPRSGTLPGVRQEECAPQGSGDQMIQAYNFRMCMTDDPSIRLPWEKPDGYDDREYELARRWFRHPQEGYNALLLPNADGDTIAPGKFDILSPKTPGGYNKTDTNNHGPFSSDFIGRNWAWPSSDYATREKIFQQHVTYQKGLYWFMANDPSVPENLRRAHRRFGLAGDEFSETGHWPHQLYVREARRMVSDYVLNEHDTQLHRQPDDPVGMGSYQMDSHNCQRFIRNGYVWNEGDVQLQPAGPYAISYRSLVPRKSECENLAVPVCISASHIAFGSVRMEPVFMALAESATLAIALAFPEKRALQDVQYSSLLPLLREANQILQFNKEHDHDVPAS
jgi:hypothetical protein